MRIFSRSIPFETIKAKIKQACIETNYILGDDVLQSLHRALAEEEAPLGKEILSQLIENARIAREQRIPLCQDTGLAVVFVELGDKIFFEGGSLVEAINQGVRAVYKEGLLRNSVCHLLTRKNTGDNTPAIIHGEIVSGDQLKISFCAKGGGSENMSRATMLKPSDGLAGVEDFVVNRVWEAQANPCPPIIVGVGIGGTIERAALLAKKSLLRPIGEESGDAELAEVEKNCVKRLMILVLARLVLGEELLLSRFTYLWSPVILPVSP